MNKPVVIGIDVRDLRLAKTGTKTYLEELCRAFKEVEDRDVSFRFLDSALPVYSGKSKFGKYLEHFNYQFWKQVSLPVKAYLSQCDVVFCTDNFVPLIHLGFKTVPVFHDAFFFENPEHYGKLWLKIYHLTAIPAAKRSAFIVTPSMYARQQIHHYTGIPPEKLKVVYEGPKTMASLPRNEVMSKYGLQSGNYILHVGSMFKRKNIPSLIYAFKKLKEETGSSIKLVLAGSSSANKDSNDFQSVLDAIQSTGMEKEVILTDYLSDTELGGIYENALMYVFPSTNEGFGIPILEAFTHQLPVLVADYTSLHEKMKMVFEDESLRSDLINKGSQRLEHFSWLKAALQLKALFISACEERKTYIKIP
jgi:glycosyltransferase involved in cell wall biosynthesis